MANKGSHLAPKEAQKWGLQLKSSVQYWLISVYYPHLHIPIHHTRQRPYLRKHTWSRPIPAVKSERAWLVLGWVTAWEHRVPLAYPFAFCFQILNYCSFIILLFYLKVIKIYIKPPLMRIISTSNYNRPPQITQKSNIRSLLKVGQLCCDRSGPVYQLTRE